MLNKLELVALQFINNGFLGGNVNFVMNGVYKDYFFCNFPFRLVLPFCDRPGNRPSPAGSKKLVINKTSLAVRPNPAKSVVIIEYECNSKQAELYVYDLTGKQLILATLHAKKGDTQLDVSGLATGVYVVVLKENGSISMQQKLVID